MVGDVQRFLTGLAVHVGQLAGCAVIERGKRGTRRFHVHFAMQGRIDHEEMEWLWGHGYVFYGDPGKYPGRTDVQRLASYLAKYLGKEMDADADAGGNRGPGMHRWLHTQGFMPDCTSRRFETPAPAEAWLILLMASPGRAASWGREKEDYAFGRFYRWEAVDWWPAPCP